jgi:hypothetical protein
MQHDLEAQLLVLSEYSNIFVFYHFMIVVDGLLSFLQKLVLGSKSGRRSL